MLDAVVVGAGPAGSIAARVLAEAGHSVAVLEEHGEPGLPVHCTGLLGLEAFEEFDLPRDTILGCSSAARFWGADGTSVHVQSPRVQAAVIDRARFDQALAARAAAAGASIRRGWRAESVAVERSGVTVTAAGGESVSARALVLACGANYRFHKPLGLGVPRAYMKSAQLETPFPASPRIDVRLGREVAPNGFAWLVSFERDDVPHARIGLMCDADGRRRFQAFADAVCAEAGIDSRDLPSPRLKLLPLAPISRTYADRVLAVGDAAGLVKPTTGGGIYYGLISGAIAAEVLHGALKAGRLGARQLRKYETRWRRKLGSEIRMALAFRQIAERLDDHAINSLIHLARVNGVVPLLQETASFNWHRKAVVSLLGHADFRKIVLRSLCA